MALVIEDGTEVADAVSYVTPEEVVAYAQARGIALVSEADADVEVLIYKAMDLLETLEPQFQGTRVTATQALSWPRQDVVLNGFDVATDTIPSVLKKSLCQLAVDADTQDLMPTSDGREVIEEKVDVLTTKYAERGVAAPQPSLTAFYNIIAPLLDSGGAFTLELERV